MNRQNGIVNPPTCCLACALHAFGVPMQTLERVRNANQSVEELLGLVNVELEILFRPITREQIGGLRRGLIYLQEENAPDRPKLLHRRYGQRKIFEVGFSVPSLVLEPLQLSRGQIFEIFQASTGKDATEQVLKQLETQFMETSAQDFEYAGLLHDDYDTYVIISPERREFKVRRPQVAGDEFTTCEFDPESQVVYQGTFERTLEGVLTALMSRVSMLIVDTASHVRGAENDRGVPSAKEWIDLFTRLYGGVEDVVIVLIISVANYAEFGMTDIQEIKRSINRDVAPEIREQVLCVDFTNATGEERLVVPDFLEG